MSGKSTKTLKSEKNKNLKVTSFLGLPSCPGLRARLLDYLNAF